MDEDQIRARLMETDQKFRKAFDQHQKLEKKLSKFQAKNFMTEEEKVKEKQLKKKKLLLKDEMYFMMTEFKKSVG
jgi:uncharacterized protein YdcH (DUF465 family)